MAVIVAVGVFLTHGSKGTGGLAGPEVVAVAVPSSSPSPTPVTCPPRPCADADGEILAARVVGRDLRPDPADNIDPAARLIALEVTFRNRTAQSKTVFTSDLELRDGGGPPSEDVNSRNPACRLWVRLDIAPGETAAPRILCFAVRPRAPGPLTLSWAPVLLQPPIDIPLA